MSAPAGKPQVVGEMAPEVTIFEFTEANRAEADRILARYPAARRQSAVLPLLHLAQAQHGGWLPQAALDCIAGLLGVPRIRVYEVATFYDMFNTVPVGRTQVRVCTTTPCWLCGSDDVIWREGFQVYSHSFFRQISDVSETGFHLEIFT